MGNTENYRRHGFIYSHDVYNGRLILLVNVFIDAYKVELLMEKSFMIGDGEFNKVVEELKIGNAQKFNLSKLDGIGIIADIYRQADGSHKIANICLDQEYLKYRHSMDDLRQHRQYCLDLRGNTNE